MEGELYSKFYEIETTHWWFTARQRILDEIIRERIKLPHGAKVLDVGCGTGAILAMLDRHYDAYGTDMSPLAIDFCRRRGLNKVFCCTLDTFPYPDLRFDLITMLDVIEHIDDDIGVLRQAFQLMKPNARILITVPAYDFLWSQYDDLNHHKRRYVRSRLIEVIRASGFSVEMDSYYNTILFPTAFVRRIFERFVKPKNDTTLEMPPRSVNTILRSVFGIERFLLRAFRLPFGLSIMAIAKKPETHPN